MPDLSIDFCGVRSPNPFWLASGPPTNTAYQVMRAFDAGWGGAVWKTIGEPIINTASRYGSIDLKNERMMGLNNIELISDRPIDVNLREIAEVKKRFPRLRSWWNQSAKPGMTLCVAPKIQARTCWS
jgi:dihydropyrimidine dehydrogenase (NAD+) subunit PreA